MKRIEQMEQREEAEEGMGIITLPTPATQERLFAKSTHRPLTKVRVAVIENPASGYNRTHPGHIASYCLKSGLPYRTGHCPETLRSSLQELLAMEPDILAVSGGDGTVSSILGSLMESDSWPPPPLALLRGGSTNLIHQELGLRGSPAQALETLRRTLTTGTLAPFVQWRSPMAVRNHGEVDEQIGFFFAVGAMQRVLRACQGISAKAGWRGWPAELLGLVLSLFGLLVSHSSNDILRSSRIDWGTGEAITALRGRKQERLFVYLTTLNKLLFGFDPLGRRNELKLVGINYPFTRRTLVSYLARRGRMEAPDVESDSADEYSLIFSGQWVLDGEFYGNLNGTNAVHVRTCEPVPFLVL